MLTTFARSMPSIFGIERAFATSLSASLSMVETTPRITPWSRRCRTSARVSISASTGTLNCSRYSSATCCERQFELTCENSRTISPSIYGRVASLSSWLVP